jgi:hypothetical protein
VAAHRDLTGRQRRPFGADHLVEQSGAQLHTRRTIAAECVAATPSRFAWEGMNYLTRR